MTPRASRCTPALLALSTLAAHGQDTFSISAMTTDGSMISATVGASSLPDLAMDVADQVGGFTSFANRSFTASLTYAGVANAASITVDPNGGGMGVETLSISLIGVDDPINFSEADGDLGDQLEDFFLRDNPGTISSFLQAINQESKVAVTDGNPLATTARSVTHRFNRFGMFADSSPNSTQLSRRFRTRGASQRSGLSSSLGGQPLALGFGQPASDSTGDRQLELGASTEPSDGSWFRTRLDISAAAFEADDGAFDGSELNVATSWETSFSKRFSLSLGIPLSYHEVNGSEVFNAGVHLDAPIKLILPETEDDYSFSWQITPGAGVDIGASYDFAAGGVLLSFGGTNLFNFSMGDFDLALPTSFYHFDSVPIETNDIEFDSGVEQQILRQGAKLSYTPGQSFSVFAGASYTRFFEEVAINEYYSPTAGLGWTFSGGGNITLAYEGDFATNDRFSRHGGRLTLNIPH